MTNSDSPPALFARGNPRQPIADLVLAEHWLRAISGFTNLLDWSQKDWRELGACLMRKLFLR